MNPVLCLNILAIAALVQLVWTVLFLVVAWKLRRSIAQVYRSTRGMVSEYPTTEEYHRALGEIEDEDSYGGPVGLQHP